MKFSLIDGVISALDSTPTAHEKRFVEVSITGFAHFTSSGHSVFVVSAGIPIDASASFWSYSPFVMYVIKSKASFDF